MATSLLDLPSEIIDNIIDLSLPAGIEGLVLTCKALYGRAKTQIERHNRLRRWRCATSCSTDVREDIIGILHQVSLDPLLVEYVEVLDLWDQRPLGLDHPETVARRNGHGPGYNFREDEEAKAKMKEIAAESAFLHHAPLADFDAWWDEMFKEDSSESESIRLEVQWRATAILLGMFPKLRNLRLSPYWTEIPYPARDAGPEGPLEELLSGIAGMVTAANAGGGDEAPLSKLETILPFMDSGYEEKAGLQVVEPFLTLKSLTEMYLVSVVASHDGYTGIPFTWTCKTQVSSITRLEFVSSCMDAEGLSNLIAYTPKLSIFKYSHEAKWHGCGHDWSPGSFVEALARHCGNSIREVALTIDNHGGEIENGASSFLALPNVQKLEVDVAIFCGPPIESGQRRGLDAFIPHGDRAWTKEDIPCIGSMIPTGVREVQMNTGPEVDSTALEALLKNLRHQRKDRLHMLERVIVRQYNDDSAQEIADHSGATLIAFDHDGHETRMRSQMPEWKREFVERVARLARGERLGSGVEHI
jgi:hypothetical protein